MHKPLGQLLDELSILMLKKEHSDKKDKYTEEIGKYHAALINECLVKTPFRVNTTTYHELRFNRRKHTQLMHHLRKLYHVNKKIWLLETQTRLALSKMHDQTVRQAIGFATMKIRKLNDKVRIPLKNQVNNGFKEEKLL